MQPEWDEVEDAATRLVRGQPVSIEMREWLETNLADHVHTLSVVLEKVDHQIEERKGLKDADTAQWRFNVGRFRKGLVDQIARLEQQAQLRRRHAAFERLRVAVEEHQSEFRSDPDDLDVELWGAVDQALAEWDRLNGLVGAGQQATGLEAVSG